jgi:hypothetical protein
MSADTLSMERAEDPPPPPYPPPMRGRVGRGAGGAACRGMREEYMTALIVGLVSIAVVWLIVIYGSIYLNKNVQ